MRRWILIGFLSLGFGCHKEPQPLISAAPASISVQCLLPTRLANPPDRLQRFQARATHLELRTETKESPPTKHTFVPGDWDRIQLPELPFPKGTEDVLKVRVKVWDKTAAGLPRAHPALSGNVQISAGELEDGKTSVLPIKLSLHVPVGEYD